MRDERYPVYSLSTSKGLSVFEKELDIPLEDFTKYVGIDNNYWAMQSLIEEVYNEQS